MTVKYRRVPFPDNIIPTGPKADYYIELDGVRVGFVWGTQAGRSSGTYSHWHAARLNGERVGRSSYGTFRKLKDDIAAYHLHLLLDQEAP